MTDVPKKCKCKLKIVAGVILLLSSIQRLQRGSLFSSESGPEATGYNFASTFFIVVGIWMLIKGIRDYSTWKKTFRSNDADSSGDKVKSGVDKT